MVFKIRKLQLKDADDISGIIRDLGWFDHLESEPVQMTIERIREHISQCLADDSHSVYAAEDESQRTIGYASVHFLPYLFLPGPEGYVSELFIASQARGHGIGTALLDQVIDDAKQRGCSRLSLINSRTRESYERKFYESHGWKERTEVAAFVFPLI
jgi:GNAT superfamily N-acetyltransferase